jgi:5-methyltetrahydrofolate--homocysteine methyltransferase
LRDRRTINPDGPKKLAAELEAGDFSTVEADAVAQVACGATVLDINAGWSTIPTPTRTRPSRR